MAPLWSLCLHLSCCMISGAIVRGYIQNYIESMGDCMPTTGDVHLPSCTNVKYLMEQYQASYRDTAVGKKYFYEIFKKYFPHVKFPKVRI